ncbi:MAG: right-handed parallel beta-helix repeat-containing protein [Crocinitomicaceae bacterium]|nr:right-handed parallel beta-helix repeat-containing protein [Crocinitomicaceae bacterium]
MKYLILFLISTAVLISCKKNDPVTTIEPGVIENRTFTSTVLIDGHDFDGTIIRNCIFEDINGDGLQIRDVDNLCIEDCIFRNISEDGIRFRNSGSSNGVKIANSQFYNIGHNGILAPENHINTLIQGNIMDNVATNNTSSLAGAPHHGIYFQGENVTITENEIHRIVNNQGNCVSIRTYGTISRNILYDATDHGISYFSDHPGYGEELLIENNFIYDNGKRAINLGSNGDVNNHIGSANIRFNTLLSDDQSTIGLQDDLTGVTFDLTANILIRTDAGSLYVFTSLPYTDEQNMTGSDDMGFADFVNRDFHLFSISPAANAAVAVTNFPLIDIDGDERQASGLDVGADEI